MIKLKGARVRQLTYRDFALYQATHAATYLDNLTDPANPVTYSGVDLKALVGLVDDNHPRTFNEALATTAPGYIVRVVGADGFAHDFASADVAHRTSSSATGSPPPALRWRCRCPSAPPSTRAAQFRRLLARLAAQAGGQLPDLRQHEGRRHQPHRPAAGGGGPR